jgi:hypothetical protein
MSVYGHEDPKWPKSRNGIGNVKADMGKHEEALVQFQIFGPLSVVRRSVRRDLNAAKGTRPIK